MRRFLFFVFLLSLLGPLSAQYNPSASLAQQYGNFIVNAATQFNKVVLADFIAAGVENRFQNNYWLAGGVTNYFEYTLSAGYQFNFDYLGQELHARWKDTSIIVDSRSVKRFYLDKGNDRHYFVKNLEIDGKGKYFFESLAYDEAVKDSSKFQLLKLRLVKRIRANKNDYLANFSGDYSDTFNSEYTYYLLLPDHTYTKIKLNRKSFQGALVKYKDQTETVLTASPAEYDEATAAAIVRKFN
ncbi:MAG: hypothetical protein RL732_511 [Bacteroidota bacterium]|jgi:hypothetical protein